MARIALVVDLFPELSETFISGEARALRRLGHEVRVEAVNRARRPDPEAAAGLATDFACDDARGDRLRALAWVVARHPIRAVRDVAAIRRWRREERAWPLRAVAPVARRLHRTRAKHVHAHFAAEAALVAMRAAALTGLPWSVATHGYDIFGTPQNLREKHERASFAVTACEDSARFLRERLGREATARLHVLVTGVDPERFRRTAPYPGGRTVLAVARLVEKKGLRDLIAAAELLRDRGRPLDAVLVAGDGPLRAALAEQVAAAGLGDTVDLLGARPPDEVRALLERADALAMPCVVAPDGDRDTMPVVVKEALAMEVPVVATDEVGLPEVVRPEWGRLAPPRDPAALADALDELLSLPAEERARMGARGRAFVAEHCSLEGGAARLAELIAVAAK